MTTATANKSQFCILYILYICTFLYCPPAFIIILSVHGAIATNLVTYIHKESYKTKAYFKWYGIEFESSLCHRETLRSSGRTL